MPPRSNGDDDDRASRRVDLVGFRVDSFVPRPVPSPSPAPSPSSTPAKADVASRLSSRSTSTTSAESESAASSSRRPSVAGGGTPSSETANEAIERGEDDAAPASEETAKDGPEESTKDGPDPNDEDDELIAAEKTGPDSRHLSSMRRSIPDSTPAERARFLVDRRGDVDAAIDKLRKYLEWREEEHDPKLMARLSDPWTYATRLAVRRARRERGATASGNEEEEEREAAEEAARLPKVIYVHERTVAETNDTGEEVVVRKKYYQLLCGRLDIRRVDPQTYARTTALYIDHVLDRSSLDKYTIVADLRAGHGWANVPALKNLHLLPFLQAQARLLQDLFPRRIEHIVVFPIPRVCTCMWDLVVPFLGSDTRQRVRLVCGMGVGKDSKPPRGLRKHIVEEGLIDEFERTREGTFVR